MKYCADCGKPLQKGAKTKACPFRHECMAETHGCIYAMHPECASGADRPSCWKPGRAQRRTIQVPAWMVELANSIQAGIEERTNVQS